MIRRPTCLLIFLVLLTAIGCTQDQHANNPDGYNLTKPTVYTLPAVLNEVSGIAFKNGNADTVYAGQDEEGRLFYFHPGDKEVNQIKFSKRGDFEDVALCNEYAVMLRSDGALFTFPVNEMYKKEAEQVNEQEGVLPVAEYESLYADASTNSVYVLCKTCTADKKGQAVSGYILHLHNDGKLTPVSNFSIGTKAIARLAGAKKIEFKPAALAKNPLTNEWYVLSSVNRMLVIADAQWNPQKIFRLNAGLFTQPEGMSFDSGGNLYIANERGNSPAASILQFLYHKK